MACLLPPGCPKLITCCMMWEDFPTLPIPATSAAFNAAMYGNYCFNLNYVNFLLNKV